MKPLDDEIISAMTVEACAGLVLETVPAMMRTIRREMHRNQATELSMPQFRALQILRRHPGATLSHVAEHLGLTLATTSKLIDGLVKEALVTRVPAQDDRRKVDLHVTEAGHATLAAAWKAAEARLTTMLTDLNAEDREMVGGAMRILRGVLDANRRR